MLIKCKECNGDVSDRAINCPHCGYPLKRKSKSNKRMRLPNGFGQISEIKGRNLRKPFRAMVSVGKTETGRPIVKPLKPNAYFKSYNEAYEALIEYNKSPYDIESNINMNDLFKRWSEYYYKRISKGRSSIYTSTWKYCDELYNIRVADLRAKHVRGIIENNKTPLARSTKINIKMVLNLMMDYAVEYELTDKNYARDVKIHDNYIEDEVQNPHIAYSHDEIESLWKHKNNHDVSLLLINIYSGWRPGEFWELKTKDFNVEEMTITGGAKTKAGKNRVVPVHEKIKDLVKNAYQYAIKNDKEYLFSTYRGRKITRRSAYTSLAKVKALTGISNKHRPHDARKTFVTLAKEADVNEYAIKRIVGHYIADITEKVYTERDINWIRQEINKI